MRLSTPTLARGQSVEVFVDVQNTGARAGDEIVQVYVHDRVCSVTWVGKALKGYARVHLEVIERFGRFPHRNIVFGRDTTPEEQAFLDGGGFSG